MMKKIMYISMVTLCILFCGCNSRTDKQKNEEQVNETTYENTENDTTEKLLEESTESEEIININNKITSNTIVMQDNYFAGVTQDGTVRYVGDIWLEKVQTWKNVVSLYGSEHMLIGIKRDGSINAVYDLNYVDQSFLNYADISTWDSIVDIAITGYYQGFVGLKSDGSLITYGVDFENHKDVFDELHSWNNVIDIEANDDYILGLKNDGTVLWCKLDTYDDKDFSKIEKWSDITEIVAGRNGVTGLHSDGTVEFEGDLYNSGDSEDELDFLKWKSIKSIKGDCTVVGILEDGTIVGTGSVDVDFEASEITSLQNITEVFVCWQTFIAMDKNGMLYLLGSQKDFTIDFEEIFSWTDIAQPSEIAINAEAKNDNEENTAGTANDLFKNDFENYMYANDSNYITIGEWQDENTLDVGNGCIISLEKGNDKGIEKAILEVNMDEVDNHTLKIQIEAFVTAFFGYENKKYMEEAYNFFVTGEEPENIKIDGKKGEKLIISNNY